MRSLEKFWAWMFKRRTNVIHEAEAHGCGQGEAFPHNNFTGKSEHYFADKGWRLLTHISCASPTAKPKDTYDFDPDEDILERIDFFACLFSNSKIE